MSSGVPDGPRRRTRTALSLMPSVTTTASWPSTSLPDQRGVGGVSVDPPDPRQRRRVARERGDVVPAADQLGDGGAAGAARRSDDENLHDLSPSVRCGFLWFPPHQRRTGRSMMSRRQSHGRSSRRSRDRRRSSVDPDRPRRRGPAPPARHGRLLQPHRGGRPVGGRDARVRRLRQLPRGDGRRGVGRGRGRAARPAGPRRPRARPARTRPPAAQRPGRAVAGPGRRAAAGVPQPELLRPAPHGHRDAGWS